MHSIHFCSKDKIALLVLILVFFLLLTSQLKGQQLLTINAGIGYTAVDKEKWSDYDELNDWNQMMIEGYAQFYFLKWGNLDVGTEAGFQDLFWYEYEYYDGYYRSYYEYDVNCWRLAAVLKKETGGKMYSEFGAGIYLFEDFTDLGITGALGYRVKVNEKMSLPVKFRAAIIFDDATNLYVLGLNIGLAFNIDI